MITKYLRIDIHPIPISEIRTRRTDIFTGREKIERKAGVSGILNSTGGHDSVRDSELNSQNKCLRPGSIQTIERIHCFAPIDSLPDANFRSQDINRRSDVLSVTV
jgi:hypothetical protein